MNDNRIRADSDLRNVEASKWDHQRPRGSSLGIDYFSRTSPVRGIASAVALRARTKMFRILMDSFDFGPQTRVLDVGVTPDETLPDSNIFEVLYEFPQNITATSIEDASNIERAFPGVTFVRTTGVTLPFDDKAFDVAVCFAVLEHVGSRDQQRALLRELARVSRWAFITTPDRGFPIEVHTFLPLLHWLPLRAHQWALRSLGMRFWAKTDNLNLLNARELKQLAADVSANAKLRRFRLFGLSQNLLLVLKR